jgi:uncharacterized protein (UPF0335 family)
MALSVAEKTDTKTGGIAADRLRSLVDRIERLEEGARRSAATSDIYAEAKSALDVKVLRQLIRIRRREPADVESGDIARRVSARVGHVAGQLVRGRRRIRAPNTGTAVEHCRAGARATGSPRRWFRSERHCSTIRKRRQTAQPWRPADP